ncbi:unnamed protein product [Polarella glacialis]|uniref:Pseudouridine synthase RsuA/RluA-like domain-containing protein n=1 Tax=Polarella glacialis TaxID=89957 RepID=A0A813GFJ2_POLGL|nr:unnamed protein product [Polarella glacialis]
MEVILPSTSLAPGVCRKGAGVVRDSSVHGGGSSGKQRPAGVEAALLALGQSPTVDQVQGVLRDVLEEWSAQPRAATLVLSGLAKASRAATALQVLAVMRRSQLKISVIHFNSAISACQKVGQWQMSLNVLCAMMPETRVEPDQISYNSAISACAKTGQWRQALILLGMMPEAKVAPDKISFNSAITACEKGSQWQIAVELLSLMPQARVVADQVSYSCVISACSKGGQWQIALNVLSVMMPGAKIVPDLISHNGAINACATSGQWQHALHVLRKIPAAKVVANVVSYNSAISACEKGSQWKLALDLLDSMPEAKVVADKITYSSAISACAQGGQWQHAVKLLSVMPEATVLPNIFSYNSAITACEKGGQWQHAHRLLSMMPGAKIGPDQISYNSAISACEKGREWQMAVKLLSMMPEAKIVPDQLSYSSAISACEKAGDWPMALSLLQVTLGARVVPDEITYNSVITACSKSGQWHLALKLLSMMPEGATLNHATAWGSVLLSMAMSGNQELKASLMKSLRLQWLESASCFGRYPSSKNFSFGGFQVLLESDGLFAVFKPAGITTEELVARLSQALLSEGYPRDITLSSRLDVETSGVLPLAFGPESSAVGRWLTVQFAARQVAKEYICLCAGPILGPKGTQGEIDNPLQVLKTVGAGTGMLKAVWSSSGKAARTQYEVLEVFQQPLPALANEGDAIMMLLVRPLTGRTHQIRSHLAGIGRPIVGDGDYGGLQAPWCRRVLLHCRRLSLMDLNGRMFQPEAPFPIDLLETLQFLGYDPIAGSCDGASDVNVMMRGRLV